MTLTPNAERFTVELSLPVLTRSVAAGIRTPNLPLAGRPFLLTAPPPRLHYTCNCDEMKYTCNYVHITELCLHATFIKLHINITILHVGINLIS